MNSRRYFINLSIRAALGATLATMTGAGFAQQAPVTDQ